MGRGGAAATCVGEGRSSLHGASVQQYSVRAAGSDMVWAQLTSSNFALSTLSPNSALAPSEVRCPALLSRAMPLTCTIPTAVAED